MRQGISLSSSCTAIVDLIAIEDYLWEFSGRIAVTRRARGAGMAECIGCEWCNYTSVVVFVGQSPSFS